MVAALKQIVTVQPGGVVEVQSDQLRPGSQAEVIVLVDEQASADREMTWSSFIGKGRGAFGSIEEVDAYIREVRDWGDRDPDP